MPLLRLRKRQFSGPRRDATSVVWLLQMSEEQRQVALSQAQPEGLGPFFRLASLFSHLFGITKPHSFCLARRKNGLQQW